jgi:1-acyl-sn-glycerol-3-phosphate acyltransferase
MLYRAGLGMARMFLGALRVRRLLTGVTNIPDAGGAVLAITHFGYLEFALVGIVVWLRTRRPIRFLVTSTAFEKPIIGSVLRRAQQIPVDLSAGGDAYNEAVLALRSGALVGVFPEGGVDASFTVRKLKTGAVRLAREAGVPVIPIAVWGGQRLFTKAHRIGFWERFGIPVSFAFGAPMDVSLEERHIATVALRARLQGQLAVLQSTYPDDGFGQWWQPRRLGGTAPTPVQALALDERLAAERAAAIERRRFPRG